MNSLSMQVQFSVPSTQCEALPRPALRVHSPSTFPREFITHRSFKPVSTAAKHNANSPSTRNNSLRVRAANTDAQAETASQLQAAARSDERGVDASWESRLTRGTAELDALLADGKEELALALVKRLAGVTDDSGESQEPGSGEAKVLRAFGAASQVRIPNQRALLADGKEELALALVKRLAGVTDESGDAQEQGSGDFKVLRAFGAASQVPRRSYTIDELKLHRIDPAKMLAPRDATLAGVRQGGQLALLAGLVATWWGEHLDQWQLLGLVIGLLFIGTADQISTGGGGEALLVDTLGNLLSPTYGQRVARHEAGHFLISYLVGIPPGAFTLSSLDAYRRYGALNVQAGTTFLDSDFQKQTKSGQIKSDMLDAVSCVALAGVCAEYLEFGVAEGGISDIQQLDLLYKSLGFTQRKSDDVVRWAVLNVATLLRRHQRLYYELADAMASGESVGQCVALIEKRLAKADLV